MISPSPSVEQLLAAARKCSPSDRSALLDRLCPDAPDLRKIVEQRLLLEEASEAPTQDLTPPVDGEWPLSRTEEARFSAGQVIAGRFVVVRYIKRGGMGEVYEVEDRYLQGAHVALKIILPEIAADAGSSRRFEQEVLLARKVTHPRLCPIYDIARCADPPPPFLFLTMKFVSGETLSERLKREERLSRQEKIRIFLQMVDGVAAIHAAGVIHRDIKPNNVMLEGSGPDLRVVILDFGLARLHKAEETMGTGSLVAGTPGYMAPEITQGPSQATDIFALGVVLHQVLTGKHPLGDGNGFPIEPSPALSTADAPPMLIEAVKEFLSTDPARRTARFDRIKSAMASSDPGTVWAISGFRPRYFSRRQFAIGAAIAACAAAGGIGWKWDQVYDFFHRLPSKRFVALLDWPASDAAVKPTLLSVIDALASELARAEAVDHNLSIIPPPKTQGDSMTPAQLTEIRDSLGANLILATSGERKPKAFHLLFRVLDAATQRVMRQKALTVPIEQQLQLPQKAVQIVAELLNISGFTPDDQRSKVGTENLDAYHAFQEASTLMKQENDTGLDAAITKYKEAIELDPHYALAQAMLAWAYLRSYAIHGDPGALVLARTNGESATQPDPGLVEAHVALAYVYQQTGNRQGQQEEMSKALSIDPLDTHSLLYQAKFYAADNQWQQAEETFDKITKLRPNYWLAYHELGVIYDQQGKYHEALVAFRSASSAAPRNALALNNVGQVYLQLGKLSDAITYLNASLALNPRYAPEGLAEVYRQQRRFPEAIDYAQRAVKIDPTRTECWLGLGDVYLSAGKSRSAAHTAYQHAADTKEEELQTLPKDGPGWMQLALYRIKAGQPATAPELVARAEALHADDMDSQLAKIRILELLGSREEALATIKRCLERGPTLFQIQAMPDLEKLRATPAYKTVEAAAATTGQLAP
jgi:serine/threonine protein kinase/Flp pilus assembly protein TadD